MKNKYIKLKKELLIEIGIKQNKILYFEDEVYKELEKYSYNNKPLSKIIKDEVPKEAPGHCFERSQLLSFAFKNPILSRCEVDFNNGRSMHCFIENDGFIYDPTKLVKIEKSLYYKMYNPKILKQYDKNNLNDLDIVRNAEKNSKESVKKYVKM